MGQGNTFSSRPPNSGGWLVLWPIHPKFRMALRAISDGETTFETAGDQHKDQMRREAVDALLSDDIPEEDGDNDEPDDDPDAQSPGDSVVPIRTKTVPVVASESLTLTSRLQVLPVTLHDLLHSPMIWRLLSRRLSCLLMTPVFRLLMTSSLLLKLPPLQLPRSRAESLTLSLVNFRSHTHSSNTSALAVWDSNQVGGEWLKFKAQKYSLSRVEQETTTERPTRSK